jgi:RNA polymerase sigma factor for flagellar operon FliA
MSDLNTLLEDSEREVASATIPRALPATATLWWTALAGADVAAAAEARRDLITFYAPLVTQIALRMVVRLPDTVELGDLVSYGMFGLIDAVEKFEPERGFKFETYAATRIRGAIIDELRAADWVPRSVRSKARQVDIDVLVRDGSDLDREVPALSLRVPSAGSAVDGRETLVLLGRAIRGVKEREQEVLRLYYFENLTLGQIGKILGVTESRVSQIHTSAVAHLRETLVRTGAFD